MDTLSAHVLCLLGAMGLYGSLSETAEVHLVDNVADLNVLQVDPGM